MKHYINLLPPSEQSLLRTEKTYLEVLNFGVLLAASLVILAVLLFVLKLVVEDKIRGVQSELEAGQAELASLEQEIASQDLKTLNQDLANLQSLGVASQEWSRVLLEMARLMPQDLTLDKLTISRRDLKVEISGRAAKRSSVLEFRDELLASDYFRNVNFPLRNLERPSDVPWSYRFNLNPSLLNQ